MITLEESIEIDGEKFSPPPPTLKGYIYGCMHVFPYDTKGSELFTNLPETSHLYNYAIFIWKQ